MMNRKDIINELKSYSDVKITQYNNTLIPDIEPMLSVRIPYIRKYAKQLAKEDWKGYLKVTKNEYYEEKLLTAFVIGYAKGELDEILKAAKEFIPLISNWAVNDGFCQTFSIARKYPQEVWDFLMEYMDSQDEFKLRVIAVTLMSHYLNDEYIDRVLDVYNTIPNVGYYTYMGVAWGVATAYAKYPQKTHQFLLECKLDDLTYNKSIQKMLESYRVSDEDKITLRKMKR